jgi:hypothetical protein
MLRRPSLVSSRSAARATLLCLGAVLVAPSMTIAQDVSPAPTAAASELSVASFFEMLPGVVQTSEGSGAGVRPLLEWEPVEDADHYAVVLYAPDGDAYWAWFGADTAVHVGGEPALRDEAPGPSVVEGMSWLVIAYDVGGDPVAISAARPIAP